MRAIDADCLQQVRDVVGEQTDRLRAFRLVRSRHATRIEDDDAEVLRQIGSLLEPDPATGRKPRDQNNRLAITLDLVEKLQTIYSYFRHYNKPFLAADFRRYTQICVHLRKSAAEP